VQVFSHIFVKKIIFCQKPIEKGGFICKYQKKAVTLQRFLEKATN